MQGNLLPITLKSMRILINNVNRKLTYTKNWPFFVLSCSGVRNGIIRQERIRGIMEGGNIQLLSKRHCLPRSPEEEGGLAGAATLSKEPPEYNIPSALEPQDTTDSACCFSLTGLLLWLVRLQAAFKIQFQLHPLDDGQSSLLSALPPLSMRNEWYELSVHTSKSTAKPVFIYKSLCCSGALCSLYPRCLMQCLVHTGN